MEKKITKRDNFNEIIKIATEIGRQDLVEFATKEIALLDKKKASGALNKNQIANEEIKKVIVDTLATFENGATIVEMQGANEDLGKLSNQKISALLKQLVDSGVITRTMVNKKATFKVA
jgi:uncharacterized protein YqeY